MTMQTATLETGSSIGVNANPRLVQLGLTALAFGATAAVAPSAMMAAGAGVVLSGALAGWSVLRVIRADQHGLADAPSSVEKVAGGFLVALMIWMAHGLTAGIFDSGIASSAAILVAFAVIAIVEMLNSALACYVLKRFAATGAIGAEVAVMLNLQQKYAVSLENDNR